MMGNAAFVRSDWDYEPPASGATLSDRRTISDIDFFQKLDQLLYALNKLTALPPNWDSYGARQINVSCAAVAFHVLMDAMREDTPAPAIVPTSDGHIQFEWHMRGIDLEVEVISPVDINVMYEDHYSGQPPQELTLSYDLTALNEFVAELTRRA